MNAARDKTLWWVLGADEHNQWHQRIILASDENRVKSWWYDSLGRLPEIVLDHDSLFQAMEVLSSLSADLEIHSPTDHLFAVWVGTPQNLGVIPVVAPHASSAHQQAQQEHEVLSVVDASPLLATLARMRAIEAGDLLPDERLR